MSDSSSRLVSPDEAPLSRAELEAWLIEQGEILAAEIALILEGIVLGAYEQFLATLTPEENVAPLTAAGGDLSSLDGIPGQWRAASENVIQPRLTQMHLTGGLSAWVRSGVEGVAPVSFAGRWAQVVNESAVSYIATASNRLVGVGDSVWADVRDRTTKAIQSGATNEQLKNEVQKLAKTTEYRADMIARTETVAAYNAGNFAGAQALDQYGPAEKVWVATLDPRVRESHFQMHNKYVPFKQPFVVGDMASPMDHPLDSKGPAKEVVQCRCYAEFLFPGDTRPDGTKVPDLAPPAPPPPPPPSPPKPPKPPTAPRKPAPKPRVPRPVTPRTPSPTGAPARAARKSEVPEKGWAKYSDAKKYINERHPHLALGDEVATYDRLVIRDIARLADDMAEQHPQEWARMRYIGSQKVPADGSVPASASRFTVRTPNGEAIVVPTIKRWGRHYAHAYTQIAEGGGPGIIGINPGFAKDYAKWLLSKGSGYSSGWTFGSTPYDTLVHEFGHILDGIKTRAFNLKRGRFGGDALGIGGVEGVNPGPVLRRFLDALRNRSTENGSRYGATNHAEAYAEAFSARSLLRRGHKWTPREETQVVFKHGPDGLPVKSENGMLIRTTEKLRDIPTADGARKTADLLDAIDEIQSLTQPVGTQTLDDQIAAVERVLELVKKNNVLDEGVSTTTPLRVQLERALAKLKKQKKGK